MSDQATVEHPVVSWLRTLVREPLRHDGDYFERLQSAVQASAPVCAAC